MKILMCSTPGGDRGPGAGYKNHLEAFRSSTDTVSELTDLRVLTSAAEQFDVFWFYVRFHPEILSRVNLCRFKNSKIIVGPNVLFERGDIGPTDDWEKWFIGEARCDVYTNVADYYLKSVMRHYKGATKYAELPYCASKDLLAVAEKVDNTKCSGDKKFDVLIYLKQRVNDDDVMDIAFDLRKKLDEAGITHKTVVYGSHTREKYVQLLSEARVCAWLAIEDYCSLAQIEASCLGVHVVGTPYNTTHALSTMPQAVDSQEFKDWVIWKKDSAAVSIKDAIVESLSKIDYEAVANHAIQTFSHKPYVERVRSLLEDATDR